MNLSEIVQQHLNDIHSPVLLGRDINGNYPENGAFAALYKRHITIRECKESRILLFLENDWCFSRCLVSETILLATLIHLWLVRQISVDDLAGNHNDIELFRGFDEDTEMIPDEKLIAWNKMKNLLFKQNGCPGDFIPLENTMILESAFHDPLLRQLYPYPSLGRICFSNKKDGFSSYLCISTNQQASSMGKYTIHLPPDSYAVYTGDLAKGFILLRENIYFLEKFL